MMFTVVFWKLTLERALKSAAQAGALALGATKISNIEEVVSTASLLGYAILGAFVLSALTSVGSAQVGKDKGSPSLVSSGAVVE